MMHLVMRLLVLGLVAFGNWLALWVLVSAWYVFKSLFDGGSMQPPIWTMGVTVSVVVALGVAAASPLGERFYRLFYPLRRPTVREAAELKPAFERVREAYVAEHRRRLKVALFLIDDPMPQAIALGRGTIAVTRGALELSDGEELSGLLAHETAHLHHKDSVLSNAIIGMSTVTHLLAMAFRLLLRLSLALPPLFLLTAVPLLMLGFGLLANKAIYAAVSFMLRLSDRATEYRADRFAGELGFASGLAGFLDRLAGMETKTGHGFLAMSLKSHPPIALRIDRLEQMQEMKAVA